jgi:hypothetical protein
MSSTGKPQLFRFKRSKVHFKEPQQKAKFKGQARLSK